MSNGVFEEEVHPTITPSATAPPAHAIDRDAITGSSGIRDQTGRGKTGCGRTRSARTIPTRPRRYVRQTPRRAWISLWERPCRRLNVAAVKRTVSPSISGLSSRSGWGSITAVSESRSVRGRGAGGTGAGFSSGIATQRHSPPVLLQTDSITDSPQQLVVSTRTQQPGSVCECPGARDTAPCQRAG